MRAVDLDVLVHEGPTARCYLARLRRLGLRPDLLTLLVHRRHATSGRPLARWLPPRWRRAYAEAYQSRAYHHWPERLRREHPALLRILSTGLAGAAPDAAELLDEIASPFRYEEYAGYVERLPVEGLGDPALRRHLERRAPRTVLFTGGGLVPPALLAIPGLRMLHVHPGRLPRVRGADGLLWSVLVRGRPAASAFFLDPGIDLGDLVAARDFEPLRFPLAGPERADDETLYRALFAFVDPVLRAETLAHTLAEQGIDPDRWTTQPQDADAGVTFHFLHPRLRREGLARLFPEGEARA